MAKTITVKSTVLVKKFREYMARVERGDTVIITHYGRPRAVLMPIAQQPEAKGESEHEPA